MEMEAEYRSPSVSIHVRLRLLICPKIEPKAAPMPTLTIHAVCIPALGSRSNPWLMIKIKPKINAEELARFKICGVVAKEDPFRLLF